MGYSPSPGSPLGFASATLARDCMTCGSLREHDTTSSTEIMDGKPLMILFLIIVVLADDAVGAGQAASWYSWMMPPIRVCFRVRKVSRSTTSAGRGLSGAAPANAMWGRWVLWWVS